MGGGRGENKVPEKKTDIRAEKGQRKKKSTLGWTKDRKENPISAPSIHVGALVGAGEPAHTRRTIHWMSIITELWMNLNWSYYLVSSW